MAFLCHEWWLTIVKACKLWIMALFSSNPNCFNQISFKLIKSLDNPIFQTHVCSCIPPHVNVCQIIFSFTCLCQCKSHSQNQATPFGFSFQTQTYFTCNAVFKVLFSNPIFCSLSFTKVTIKCNNIWFHEIGFKKKNCSKSQRKRSEMDGKMRSTALHISFASPDNIASQRTTWVSGFHFRLFYFL